MNIVFNINKTENTNSYSYEFKELEYLKFHINLKKNIDESDLNYLRTITTPAFYQILNTYKEGIFSKGLTDLKSKELYFYLIEFYKFYYAERFYFLQIYSILKSENNLELLDQLLSNELKETLSNLTYNNWYKKIRNQIIFYKYGQNDFKTSHKEIINLLVSFTKDILKFSIYSQLYSNLDKNNEIRNIDFNKIADELIKYFNNNFSNNCLFISENNTLIEDYLLNFGLRLENKENSIFYYVNFIDKDRKLSTVEKSNIIEFKSKKIYIDQQVWSFMRTNKQLDKKPKDISLKLKNKLSELKNEKKVDIFYSVFNIFEAIDGNNDDIILDQILLIEDLCIVNMIDGDYQFKKNDPINLLFYLKNCNSFSTLKEVLLLFIEIIDFSKIIDMKNYGFNFGNIKQTIKNQNIPPDKIIDLLKQKEKKNNKKITDDINNIKDYLEQTYPENIKKIENLLEKLLSKFTDYTHIIYNLLNIENLNIKEIIVNYIYLLISFIKNKIEKNKDKYNPNWIDNLFNEETYSFLLKINPGYSNLIPAIYVLCLDILNFYPDEKSNRSKDPIKRTYDALHYSIGCHCDYFITEDTALLEKAKVLKDKYKTNVVDMNEFLKEDL